MTIAAPTVKPRIRRSTQYPGKWVCRSPYGKSPIWFEAGYGDTPEEAYAEWRSVHSRFQHQDESMHQLPRSLRK